MLTVLESPRNSSARRISVGRPTIKVPCETLKVLQPVASHTGQAQRCREDSVTEYRVFGPVANEDILPDVEPLPWRQCAVVMVLASVGVYGVGFLVVTAFDHLFKYLQL